MGKLTGKTALTTDASHRIGEGITITLAKHGAKLTLLDISGEIELSAQKLNKQRCPYIALDADVRNLGSMVAAVAKGKEAMGNIDILVNDAGVCRLGGFLEMSGADRDFHIDINIKRVWNIARTVLPGMVAEKDGRIVIMSSVTGDMIADPGEIAYVLSKAALVSLIKPLAVEPVQSGIRVNAICPGCVRTPMAENIARQPNAEDPEFILTEVAKAVPMRRLATPTEIGKLAAFLDPDESGHLTGTQSVIDGGSTLPESVGVGV